LKETNECTIDNMKYLTYILEKCKNIWILPYVNILALFNSEFISLFP
jgi:hypothetical protein